MKTHPRGTTECDNTHPPDLDKMLRDRYRGALLGLAVGDALGTTVEFKAPGTFKPVTEIVGGGRSI